MRQKVTPGAWMTMVLLSITLVGCGKKTIPVARPTPPAPPKTATVSPGFTFAALFTAPNPVTTAHPSSAAVARRMALSGSYPLHALDLFFSRAHPMS